MFPRIKRFLIRAGITLLGVYCCGYALWNMGKTAIFLHESTVVKARVVDMVQYPFDSYAQAMAHGNLPWEGDTAYQVTLDFTLPTNPVAIHIPKMQMPDLDNRDYGIGQEVDILVPLTDPARAHLYRWKFLWGADCILLLFGLVMGCTGYLLLRRRRRKSSSAPRHRNPKRSKARNTSGSAPQNIPMPKPIPVAGVPAAADTVFRPKQKRRSPQHTASKKASGSAAEEVLQLVSDPLPPKKKRGRKPKDQNATATPRTRKKKSNA